MAYELKSGYFVSKDAKTGEEIKIPIEALKRWLVAKPDPKWKTFKIRTPEFVITVSSVVVTPPWKRELFRRTRRFSVN